MKVIKVRRTINDEHNDELSYILWKYVTIYKMFSLWRGPPSAIAVVLWVKLEQNPILYAECMCCVWPFHFTKVEHAQQRDMFLVILFRITW